MDLVAANPAAVALLMSIPVPIPLTASDSIPFPAVGRGLVESHRIVPVTSPGCGFGSGDFGTEGGSLGHRRSRPRTDSLDLFALFWHKAAVPV